jgi:tetratricopeptide (TPR) repeat protein
VLRIKGAPRRYLPILWVVTAAALALQSARAQPANSFTIKSEPDAAVWLNGVHFGRTGEDGTLKIASPPAGRKTLRVRADGFKEVTRALAPTVAGEISITLAKTSDPAELAFQKAESLTSVDREKAAAPYREAIRLRPGFVDAYVGLARVLTQAREREAAEKTIRELRKIRPAHAEASVIEGRLLKELGEEDKAIAAYRRALREGGGFQPEAYAGLGILYKERAESFGNEGELEAEKAAYAEAARHFSAALKQLGSAPDAIVIYQLLGLVYEQSQRYREAIALYEEFLRIFPGSSEATAVSSFITQLKKQLADQ